MSPLLRVRNWIPPVCGMPLIAGQIPRFLGFERELGVVATRISWNLTQ